MTAEAFKEVKCLRVLVDAVKVLKKEKSRKLTRGELAKKLQLGSKSKMLDRVLSCLAAAGFARWEAGEVELVEGWQVFLDRKGYDIKLEHSRTLVRECSSPVTVITSDGPTELKVMFHFYSALENKAFMQHIESGYPNVYREVEAFKRLRKSEEERYHEFREEVKKMIRENGFEPVESPRELEVCGRQVHYDLIVDIVEKMFRGKIEQPEIKVGISEGPGGGVEVLGNIVSQNKDLADELSGLVGKLIGSKELKEAYGKYLEASKHREEKEAEVKAKLEDVAMKVRHGEPLKGWCDLCPEVEILK